MAGTTYWAGVRGRAIGSAVLGVVVGAVTGLLWGVGPALIVGVSAFLSALLLPAKPARDDEPGPGEDAP